MPFSASDESRRAAQQRANRQHADQFQKFHRQNQQLSAAQMSDMMERSRSKRREGRRQERQVGTTSAAREGQEIDYGAPGQVGQKDFADGNSASRLIDSASGVALFVMGIWVFVVALFFGQDTSISGAPDPASVEPDVPPVQIFSGSVITQEWNVRSAPSVESDVVGAVAPGDAVTVKCLNDGWARLVSPLDGSYVDAEGLELSSLPPAC